MTHKRLIKLSLMMLAVGVAGCAAPAADSGFGDLDPERIIRNSRAMAYRSGMLRAPDRSSLDPGFDPGWSGPITVRHEIPEGRVVQGIDVGPAPDSLAAAKRFVAGRALDPARSRVVWCDAPVRAYMSQPGTAWGEVHGWGWRGAVRGINAFGGPTGEVLVWFFYYPAGHSVHMMYHRFDLSGYPVLAWRAKEER